MASGSGIKAELVDELLKGQDPKTLFERDGLLDELKKALAERALNAELDHHLEQDAEQAAGNHRNGSSSKTMLSDTGPVTLSIPRDRQGRFEPQLIAKYQRRFPGFDEKIIALYARGMSTREIQAHLRELYGTDISPELVSAVDAVVRPANGVVHLPEVIADVFGGTRSEARRTIAQGGVKLDGEPVAELNLPADRVDGRVLQVGKRRFRRLRVA